ncbi:MAG: VIT family protein [Planctomycetota bacterium]
MPHHHERHRSDRVDWLRAAVLGANDGIVSTASLVVGVAAANVEREGVLLAGVAGLVAGAMSMAAGEYVSVSSQADLERADLAQEKRELHEDPVGERRELALMFEGRGLDPTLASLVATQLTEHDALAAHAAEELGIPSEVHARPVQAALASAAAFALGAALPLGTVLVAPRAELGWAVVAASLACLAFLGLVSARAGGAEPVRAAVRIVFWGALAMTLTAGIGSLFDAPIA